MHIEDGAGLIYCITMNTGFTSKEIGFKSAVVYPSNRYASTMTGQDRGTKLTTRVDVSLRKSISEKSRPMGSNMSRSLRRTLSTQPYSYIRGWNVMSREAAP
eukprot:scaffold84687_cov61-Attheya_sp.AAC.1